VLQGDRKVNLSFSNGTLSVTGMAAQAVPASGMVKSDGTNVAAATLGTNLSYSAGTLTLTGMAALAVPASGMVASNGTTLAAATLGTNLSFSSNTLTLGGLAALSVPASGIVSSNGTALAATTLTSNFSFSSGTLDLANQPYEPKFGFNLSPASNALLFGDFATRAVSYLGNFSGSNFRVNTAPTSGDWIAVIKKNGSQVGLLTVPNASNAGTFTTIGGGTVSLVATDYFEVVGPATPDATIAQGYGTFVGKR
jgi:hypothetical protein